MDEIEEVVDLIGELKESLWTFSLLASAVDMGLFDTLASPRTISFLAGRTGAPEALVERVLDVLAALDLVSRDGDVWAARPGLSPFLTSPGKDLLQAELRAACLQAMSFVNHAGRKEPGGDKWNCAEEDSLQAQSIISAVSTEMMMATLFPQVPGLLSQLTAPGAEFLDVGAGAGGVAITIGRHFPGLRVVALEPDEAALLLARKNVGAAGLGQRIELRQLLVEELRDSDRFETAYVSQMFLSATALERGLMAVQAALRPGGWLLMTAASVSGAGLLPTLSRLRNELLGGGARLPEDLTTLLTELGYEEVRAFEAEGTITPVIGRRPPR